MHPLSEIPQISVIIPTYNRSNMLKRALASIVDQNMDAQYYEIIVIDNGSTDSTADVVKQCIKINHLNKISYRYEPNPGLHAGRHRGAAEARSDVLTFVDDDIEATRGWLEAIKDAFDDDKVGIVGGPSWPIFENSPPDWLKAIATIRQGRITCGPLSLIDLGDQAKPIPPEFVWGLNFSIRKQLLYDLGGFHPDSVPQHLLIFRGDGETGLSLKASKANIVTRYQPEAKVYHHVPKIRLTPAYLKDRFFRQGISDSYTAIRKFGGLKNFNLPRTLFKEKIFNGFTNTSRGPFSHLDAERSYANGYLFHYHNVMHHPELLNWVLHPHYFNVPLPSIAANDPNVNKAIGSNTKSSNALQPTIAKISSDKIAHRVGSNVEHSAASSLKKIYDKSFYDQQKDGSYNSAKVVIPFVAEVFPINSVVDFGCGVGTWLSVFAEQGITDVQGFDANDLSSDQYLVDPSKITTGVDLSLNHAFNDVKADLVICLEVAEHLPETAAEGLVDNLTMVAPVVLFSAAFPDQTGVNHINEQPPWYWRKKFEKRGFIEIDYLKPLIWGDTRVCWWYRQNLTIYVAKDYILHNKTAARLFRRFKKDNKPNNLVPVSEWILDRQLKRLGNTQHSTVLNSRIKSDTIINSDKRSTPLLKDISISGFPLPDKLFFIVGHPKSGTTWLARILNNHPDICCKYEGHFFYRDDNYLTLSNAIQDSTQLRRWLDRSFNHWSASSEDDLKYLAKLSIQFFIQKQLQLSGKKIIGDKSPSWQISEMASFFPNSHLIHIFRDGRDVVTSMAFHRSEETDRYMTNLMKRKLDELFYENSSLQSQISLPDDFVEKVAKTWKEEVTTCRKLGQSLYNKNYYEISYEDLHNDSINKIGQIFRNLGVDSSISIIKHCVTSASFKKLSNGRNIGEADNRSFFRKGVIGDFENVFSRSNLNKFNDIAAPTLSEFNYNFNI